MSYSIPLSVDTPTTQVTGIDCHCHTTASDGIQSISELVSEAQTKALKFVAVTDHDIVNREARKALEESGIQSIDSVEISGKDYENNHSLHITFYANHISGTVDDVLSGVREARTEKVRAQCELLRKNGFQISFQDLVDFTTEFRMSPDCLSNNHLSQVIFRNPFNRARLDTLWGGGEWNKTRFIRTFLKETGEHPEIGYVRVGEYEPSIEWCGEMAQKLSGVASIAHPNFSFEKQGGLIEIERRLPRYRQAGINGIEVNPFASKETVEALQKFSRKYDMILTFGSDSHGFGDDRHVRLGELNTHMESDEQKIQIQSFMQKLGR